MKVIDHTPLIDEKGQLSLINRLKGMLTYGYSWPAKLQAQEVVIDQLNRVLEKGYTLFRNQRLGSSEIIVPLVLIGPAGIYVIEAIPLKGVYRARGDEWGSVIDGRFQPDPVNLIVFTARLARAVQVFLERQGMKLAAPVEPILIAANPGLHVESIRPNVRVVMFDAIERFAAGLLTARPIYSAIQVNDLVDRLEHPRPLRPAKPPTAEGAPSPPAGPDREEPPSKPPEAIPASRLQTILHAPQSDALIETAQQRLEEPPTAARQPGSPPELAFENDTSPTVFVRKPRSPETIASQSRPALRRRRLFGLTVPQIIVLAVLVLVELCVLIGGAILIFSRLQP